MEISDNLYKDILYTLEDVQAFLSRGFKVEELIGSNNFPYIEDLQKLINELKGIK